MKNRQEIMSYKDYPIHSDNPFPKDLVVHMTENKKEKIKRVIASDAQLIDRESGLELNQKSDNLFVGTVKSVDNEQFTKVYSGAIKMMTEVSEKAIKIFMWYIFPKLEKDSLQVLFDFDECMEVTEFGKTTIYSALAELINAKLIAKSKYHYLFYINPVYVFNGDRIRIVNDFIKKGSKHDELRNKIEGQYSISQGDSARFDNDEQWTKEPI